MAGKVRAITAALALVALGAMIAPGSVEAQDRPRLAVIPFDNPTSWWGRELGASAAGQLTVKLVETGAFTMLERQKVQAIFDEWYLGQSGAVTPDKAAQVGKLLGVEYLVTGQFNSFNINTRRAGIRIGPVQGLQETRAESAMSVRVINVTTGEIVAAATAKGNKVLGRGVQTSRLDYSSLSSSSPWNPTVADEALDEASKTLAATLAGQADKFRGGGGGSAAGSASAKPAATIPKIAGMAADGSGSFYIDQGQSAGMTVGRRFNVLRVVDTIKAADGKILDQVTKRVGIIEVSQVLSQSSICKVVEGKPDVKDLLEPAS